MDKLAKVLDFFYGQDDHYQEREKGGRLLLSSKQPGLVQIQQKWKASFLKKIIHKPLQTESERPVNKLAIIKKIDLFMNKIETVLRQ